MDEKELVLLGELWRRRVEWLWTMCEATSGRELDIGWLDEQIEKGEDGNQAQRQAPPQEPLYGSRGVPLYAAGEGGV